MFFYFWPVFITLDHSLDSFLSEDFAGETFATIVYYCDGYLNLVDRSSKAGRFFSIAKKLPLELQMILCNRLHDMEGDLIPGVMREKSLKFVAKDIEGVLRGYFETMDFAEAMVSDDDFDEDSDDSFLDFDDHFHDFHHHHHGHPFEDDESEDGSDDSYSY